MSPKIDIEIIKTVKHLLTIGATNKEIKKYIKEKTGLGKTQVNTAFNDIYEYRLTPSDEDKFEVNYDDEDGAEIVTQHIGLKTLDELLDRCGIDRNEWEVKSFKPNSWPTNTKDGVVILSQVKAYLERKISRKSKSAMGDLKEDLKKLSPISKFAFDHAFFSNGRLLEVCAPDLHLGKYGVKDEVGNDYNINIAKKIFLSAIGDIAKRATLQGEISRIVFPIGNDFLNIDTPARTTTAGTPQDCDVSFSSIFRNGRTLLVEAINFLKQIAPVDVVVCRGNHDSAAMFHLGDALECWFHNDENVTIDNIPKSRKYYTYGENLILYTHGDKEKQDKLPLLAATEEPILWATCKYREIRVGHLHHEIVKEHNGVKIRVVPSLSGNDVYHYDRGYTGNIRVAQGFLFDKNTGLEGIFYSKPVQ